MSLENSKSKLFVLNNDRKVEIRICLSEDAPLFVPFVRQIAQQTPFTRYSTGVEVDVEEVARDWDKDLHRPERRHWAAFLESNYERQIVGYLKFRQPYPTHAGFKHVGDFGIMLLSEVWGQGLGSALMTEMEDYARSLGIRRIEARVRDSNSRGLALFKKLGYKIEGVRKDAVKLGDKFADECYIGKILL